jgi:RND family efflux transporter MFP subunit
MKRIIFQLFPLLTLMFFSSCNSSHSEKKFTLSQEEAIPVKLATVNKLENGNSVIATGLLATVNEAKYSFKIGGVIDRITVNEGQFFKKGQLLATLKVTEIEAQLSQANLGYEKAKRDYTRTLNLYRDSVATREQLENAKTGLDIAQKTIDAIAFNKKYAFIYGAADGFVTKKLANEGEVVSGGMPILAINETSGSNDWVLKIGVTDKEWSAIETGNKASVSLDAFPGKIFPGIVFRKSQAADQASGSLQVEVRPMLPGIKPAMGMFGKAVINVGSKTVLPTIPYEALIEADGNNAFVFVPVDSSRVKRLPIVIESFNNREVIVKSGLENVSAIVVSNSAFLNERSIITIVK